MPVSRSTIISRRSARSLSRSNAAPCLSWPGKQAVKGARHYSRNGRIEPRLMAGGYAPVGVDALTALYGRLRQLDRVLASVPARQSVWPDNGSQRLGRIIGQFDPDALLKPVFDYTPRAQNVVPFDLLNSISVTHRSSVARSITRQYSAGNQRHQCRRFSMKNQPAI